MDIFNTPDRKPTTTRRNPKQQPYTIQTMEAYEADSIVSHMKGQIEFLTSLGFPYLGLAHLMEYRERAYPSLFTL